MRYLRRKWNSDQQTVCDAVQTLCGLVQALFDIKTGRSGERHSKLPSLSSDSFRLQCDAYSITLSPSDSIIHAYRIYRTLCSTLHFWMVHNSDTLIKYFEVVVEELKLRTNTLYGIKVEPYDGTQVVPCGIYSQSLSSSSRPSRVSIPRIIQIDRPTVFQINLFGKPGTYSVDFCVSLSIKHS